MDDRPRIGICAAVEQVQFGLWNEPAVFAPYGYVRAVQAAGGLALLLVPDPVDRDAPDALLDMVDGLLLADGADIDPSLYGAEPHPATTGVTPARDTFEVELARAAFARDLPVLGICRGMQLMNVARGGTLIQHLPDVVAHEDHRRNPGTFRGNDHEVRLEAGSLAARAAAEEQHRAYSHHHQAIDRVGEGFVVTGWGSEDELPEAMEDPERRFALGVQWHPEADETSGVIASLVAEARALRAERAAAAATSA